MGWLRAHKHTSKNLQNLANHIISAINTHTHNRISVTLSRYNPLLLRCRLVLVKCARRLYATQFGLSRIVSVSAAYPHIREIHAHTKHTQANMALAKLLLTVICNDCGCSHLLRLKSSTHSHTSSMCICEWMLCWLSSFLGNISEIDCII